MRERERDLSHKLDENIDAARGVIGSVEGIKKKIYKLAYGLAVNESE